MAFVHFIVVLLGALCACQRLSFASSPSSILRTIHNDDEDPNPQSTTIQTNLISLAYPSLSLSTSLPKLTTLLVVTHVTSILPISELSHSIGVSTGSLESDAQKSGSYQESILTTTDKNTVSSSTLALVLTQDSLDTAEAPATLSSLSTTIDYEPAVISRPSHSSSLDDQLPKLEVTVTFEPSASSMTSRYPPPTSSESEEVKPPSTALSQEDLSKQHLGFDNNSVRFSRHSKSESVGVKFTQLILSTRTEDVSTTHATLLLKPQILQPGPYQPASTRYSDGVLAMTQPARTVVNTIIDHVTDHTSVTINRADTDGTSAQIATSTRLNSQYTSSGDLAVGSYGPESVTKPAAMLFGSSSLTDHILLLPTEQSFVERSSQSLSSTPTNKMDEISRMLPTHSKSMMLLDQEENETNNSTMQLISPTPNSIRMALSSESGAENIQVSSSSSVLLIDLEPTFRPSVTLNSFAFNQSKSTSVSLIQYPTGWLPSSLLTETEELQTYETEAPEANNLPLAIRPYSNGQHPPESTALFYLGFRYPLHYEFVVSTPVAAVQLFLLLPQLFLYSNGSSATSVVELKPYDKKGELNYVATVAELYFPDGDEHLPSHDLHSTETWQYDADNNTLKDLVALIDLNISYRDNSASNTNESSAEGPRKQSPHVKATIASAVVGGCVLFAGTSVTIFLGLRRYRAKKGQMPRQVYSAKRQRGAANRSLHNTLGEYRDKNIDRARDIP